jgi:hypothetical protein
MIAQGGLENSIVGFYGDRCFDTVFPYHNGAESYYAARGGEAR